MSDPGAAGESIKMADLLSAATLLLTVLGVVYGTWYSEIVGAINATVDPHLANRGPVRRTVRTALYGKAFPLAVIASALTALFLPDAVTIAVNGVRALSTIGCDAFREYNAVQAAFCMVVILTGALAGYLISLVWRLTSKLRTINTP